MPPCCHIPKTRIVWFTFGISCGYKLSLGGSLGGFSLLFGVDFEALMSMSRFPIRWAGKNAISIPIHNWCMFWNIPAPFSAANPELPELPPLLPTFSATLYGSSSGIGILGRFLISNGRWTRRNRNTIIGIFAVVAWSQSAVAYHINGDNDAIFRAE